MAGENVLNKIMANLLKHVFLLALNKAPINHENYSCFRDEKTEDLERLVDYLKTVQSTREREFRIHTLSESRLYTLPPKLCFLPYL